MEGSFEAGTVVNAAGLFADQVAERSGLKTQYSFQPFRKAETQKPRLLRRLVYPVPDLSLPFWVSIPHNQTGDVYFGPVRRRL